MLSRDELKSLVETTKEGALSVSFYLNVNPLTNPKGEYLVAIKDMLKEMEAKVDKRALKEIKDDIEKIKTYLNNNKREFKKAVVLFSSEKSGLWKVYHLNVPVKNAIVVDKDPFVEPLLDLIDNYPRYLVLLVDKEHARIFLVHLSEIAEYDDIYTEGIPGRHKKGGWFALAQDHYERHIDYHVRYHLQSVVERLENFVREESIDLIFLGGHEEARVAFLNMIPESIKNMIYAEFDADLRINKNDLLKKVSPLIERYEREKEKRIVDELITRTLKGQKAALGIDDTLSAVVNGSAHILVVNRDFQLKGYKCQKCEFITSQSVEKCPACGSSTEEVPYLVDFIVQRAVQEGARVEVIAYETDKLKEYGNIGAILRY